MCPTVERMNSKPRKYIYQKTGKEFISMKKRLIRTGAAILAVATLGSASMISSFAATDQTPTQAKGNTVYYLGNNSEEIGIKSISYDNKLFYDCAKNTHKKVDTDFLYEFLTTPVQYQELNGETGVITPLEQWAHIAGAIFESGGKYTCTDNYKTYYSKSTKGSSDEDHFVAGNLANPKSKQNGDTQDDNYHSTGLSVTNSFSELRNIMCTEISNRIDRFTLDPCDILGQGDNCPDALAELADSESREIIYNIDTAISRDGYTPKYKYNSYGVAFYDFDLQIIDADGVKYVQSPDKVKTESNITTSIASSTQNDTLNDTSASLSTTISETKSLSTSIAESKSHSFSQMYGGEFKAGNDDIGYSLTLKTELTASDVYESSKTHETTVVNEFSKTKEDIYPVPQHTIVNVEQNVSTDTYVYDYDTPVALTYKVVIFSMSGDVYADSVATLAFSTAGYEQSNFTTFFGGKMVTDGKYAVQSLTERINHKSYNGWDSANSTTRAFHKLHDGQGKWTDTKSYNLNWNSVISNYDRDKGNAVSLTTSANKCPMLPAGTTTTATVESINTKVLAPVPMYLPTSFKVVSCDNPRYRVYVDGTFNLGTVSINAFDKDGAKYYNFLQSDGYWSVKEGSEDIVEFDADSYCVVAKKPGVATLVWQLKDGVEYTAAYDRGTVTNANANKVEITLEVRDYPFK